MILKVTSSQSETCKWMERPKRGKDLKTKHLKALTASQLYFIVFPKMQFGATKKFLGLEVVINTKLCCVK